MSEPFVSHAAVPGWFGKLPNVGDFAQRRLPPALVLEWDHWLQDSMAYARGEFGAQWSSVYRVAPILRFWLGPGTLGAQRWAGLVMPSVDRVGRYYPLMFARPSIDLADALAARPWYAALDLTARRVLDPAFTIDALEAELKALADIDSVANDRATHALAAELRAAGDSRRACTVWWSAEAGRDAAAFMRFDGLPHSAEFTSMLGVTT